MVYYLILHSIIFVLLLIPSFILFLAYITYPFSWGTKDYGWVVFSILFQVIIFLYASKKNYT